MGLFQFWAKLLEGGKKKATGKDVIGDRVRRWRDPAGQARAQPLRHGIRGAYSTPIRKALDKIAEDKDVKAVVLRVNSPGGSAVASEIILNATQRVKAKKPFVVSMGDVAGSGGYYVSMGADTIFADAATITASIGVAGRQVRHDRHVEQDRHHLGQQPPRRQRRAAQLRRGVHRPRNARKCRAG